MDLKISGVLSTKPALNNKRVVPATNPQSVVCNNTELRDFNYGQSLVNKVSFTSNAEEKPPSLEAKIKTALYFMKPDSAVVVTNSLKSLQEALLENNYFENPLKEIAFIQEENNKTPFAILKDAYGIFRFMNIGKKDIYLRNEDDVEHIEPKRSSFLRHGDLLNIDNMNFEIDKLAEDPSLLELGQSVKHIRVFNFEKTTREDIRKINEKLFKALIREKEVVTSKGVGFKDVGGQDDLIKELKRSVIAPLKQPEFFATTMLNHGIILHGKPGTGKTYVAQALANEAGVNFFKINASEMDSKWVGGTEENWKKVFDEAIKKQPSILFIDEVDAIAKKRGGIDQYGDKALNYILSRVSELEQNKENVFIIAATNNFQALDTAFTRKGRFGKHLEVKSPDLQGTEQIFDIHAKHEKIDENFDKKAFMEKLNKIEATGADIAFIVNEARMNAFERENIFDKILSDKFTQKDADSHKLVQEDFDLAFEKNFNKGKDSAVRNPIGYVLR